MLLGHTTRTLPRLNHRGFVIEPKLIVIVDRDDTCKRSYDYYNHTSQNIQIAWFDFSPPPSSSGCLGAFDEVTAVGRFFHALAIVTGKPASNPLLCTGPRVFTISIIVSILT
jgi:hypothetical protein